MLRGYDNHEVNRDPFLSPVMATAELLAGLPPINIVVRGEGVRGEGVRGGGAEGGRGGGEPVFRFWGYFVTIASLKYRVSYIPPHWKVLGS